LYFWGGQIVFLGGQIVFLGGQIVFLGGRDAHPTRKFSNCGTGILPVLNRRLYFGAGRLYFGAGETPTPQENLVIVEQASCLFLRMVKDV
jgi:ABC-type xylose transport system permease subunit